MKVLVQRVSRGRVSVDGQVLGEIAVGLVALVGFGAQDDASKLSPMLDKLLNLRIFPDDKGRFHFSVSDTKGGVLLIPQFTLYADTSKGRRPDFFGALAPAQAEPLFQQFVDCVRAKASGTVAAGQFGAHMLVEIFNDGPVTIGLEV